MTNKQKLLDFFSKQKLAVISTSNSKNPTPESALIAFTEDENLCLYFQTGKHTRKAQNLKVNPHVSIVIGLTLEDLKTAQYEGVATRLTGEMKLKECKEMFHQKNSPTTEEYFNHPSAIFFEVTPTWIGFSDYSGKKPKVTEIKSFRNNQELGV